MEQKQPPEDDLKNYRPGIDRVAVVLAAGMVVNLLVISALVFFAALYQTLDAPGIIAATQVLTGWGGGIIGILGGYVGFRSARSQKIELDRLKQEKLGDKLE